MLSQGKVHARERSFKIAVLGMGHVGLPTAAGFAELGWHVIGADSDSAKIALIKAGECPFYEPGLKELLNRGLQSGRFELTDCVEDAIREATVLFICVGTPQAESGRADLKDVEALAHTIARNLNGYKLIVEKSTVPAVTGRWIQRTMDRELDARRRASRSNGNGNRNGQHPTESQIANASPSAPLFEIASNPEFLQEGKAVANFFQPDRIVCGVSSDRARELLAALYDSVECPILFTDLNTAELIKHAANAFLATKISFINMVADVCESIGADVTQVANGIGLDARIGSGFLQAGIGFGGYCLPKDLKAFIHLAEENNVQAALLREVEAVNHARVDRVVQKLRQALWILQGKKIAVLGLSFKAGTDDVRESPSLRVVEELIRQGANLRLYDPQAIEQTRRIIPEQPNAIVYCSDPYEAVEGTHAVVVLTDWDEICNLDLGRCRQLVNVPVLVDGRNAFDPLIVRLHGFEYFGMGRSAERRRLPMDRAPHAIPLEAATGAVTPGSGELDAVNGNFD